MAAGAPDSQPLNAGLSAQQLVSPLQPVVTPDAIAQLTDAFHKGIITAGDINDRIGAVAMANKKAHLEQLGEYVSPQAIQSRMAQIGATGAQAGLATAQANADAGLVEPAANLKRTQLAHEKAATIYGPGGMDTFNKMAPWFGESIADYTDPNGVVDFNGVSARGNEMLGQMSIADTWINRLTPAKDVEKTDAAGNKYVQKVNQWGVNVTPPDPESGYPGSSAYWAYLKQLEPVLPKAHPLRSQLMMRPIGGAENDGMLGHPADSPSSHPVMNPSQVDVVPQDRVGAVQKYAKYLESTGVDPDTAFGFAARASDETLRGYEKASLPVVQPAAAAPATSAAPTVTPLPTSAGASPTLGIPISPGQTTSVAKQQLEELPDVKAFSTSKPVYIGFADSAKSSLAQPSSVNDLSLAESYSKLFDPQSTLREFKFDALKDSIPWPQKLKDAWPLILKTHTFPADVRKAVVDSGMKVIDAREKALQPRLAYAEAQHPGVLDDEQKQILAGVPFGKRFGVPDASTAAPSNLQTLPSGRRVMWVPNP